MKRALVLMLLVAGMLPGCAAAPRSAADDTLRASLFSGARGHRVRVSEPAYVAVFDVRPGNGFVRLVYPDPAAEQVPLRRGIQTLPRGTFPTSRSGSPSVLYMIASREPLDLSRFAGTRDAREALGADALGSDALQDVIDALAVAVVTNVEGDGWTDSMVRYGTRGARASTSGGVDEFQLPATVSCGDGRTVERTGDRSALRGCSR